MTPKPDPTQFRVEPSTMGRIAAHALDVHDAAEWLSEFCDCPADPIASMIPTAVAYIYVKDAPSLMAALGWLHRGLPDGQHIDRSINVQTISATRRFGSAAVVVMASTEDVCTRVDGAIPGWQSPDGWGDVPAPQFDYSEVLASDGQQFGEFPVR